MGISVTLFTETLINIPSNLMKNVLIFLLLLVIAGLVYWQFVGNDPGADNRQVEEVNEDLDQTYEGITMDLHNHFSGPFRTIEDYDVVLDLLFAKMETYNIDKIVMMPQPFPDDEKYQTNMELLAEVISTYPDQLLLFAGGESLNKIIQRHSGQTSVSNQVRDEFEDKALELIDMGAVGFGELTALHFSLGDGHPFEETSPDHPLFLLLADIAAEHGMPVDIHMEAVPEDMDFPWTDRLTSKENPDTLQANISAFERLLEHNRDAKIIWAHAGWGNSGFRTTELMDRLFTDHNNLYMGIKIGKDDLGVNRPFTDGGVLKDEWLELITKHSDRFFMATDQFYSDPDFPITTPEHNEARALLLSQLPEDLAYQLTVTNPSVLLSN